MISEITSPELLAWDELRIATEISGEKTTGTSEFGSAG
jgi:hypothetical protein